MAKDTKQNDPVMKAIKDNVDMNEVASYTQAALKDTLLMAVIAKTFSDDEVTSTIDEVFSTEYKQILLDGVTESLKKNDSSIEEKDLSRVMDRFSELLDDVFVKIKTDFSGAIGELRDTLF